jgi:CDP-paratose 2-epimerase
MKVFITGSSGLIGSELVSCFDQRAQAVIGTDNNMRADFFGPGGDTRWNLTRMHQATRNFQHFGADIEAIPD